MTVEELCALKVGDPVYVSSLYGLGGHWVPTVVAYKALRAFKHNATIEVDLGRPHRVHRGASQVMTPEQYAAMIMAQ